MRWLEASGEDMASHATCGSGEMAELATTPGRKQRRINWLRQLYQWHWISSGICLIGMVLFAVTGLTLNHAGQIEARPVVVARDGALPAPLLDRLKHGSASSKEPLPKEIREWLAATLGVNVAGRDTEWSAREIYVALPRAGGDAWLTIDRGDGRVDFESTDRGWIAYLNDLHKGRHTGPVWSWFIDIFAVACVVFSATGLLLLQRHAAKRPATWPVVGLGLVIPVLLLVLLVHH